MDDGCGGVVKNQDNPAADVKSNAKHSENTDQSPQDSKSHSQLPQNSKNPDPLPQDSKSRDQPAQDSESRDQPAQDSESRDQPAQDSESRDQPAQDSESRDQPAQDSESRDQPAQDSESRDQPAQDSESRDQPAQDSESRDQPAQDSESRDQPAQDSESRDQPAQDSESRDQPAQDSESRDQPAQDSESRDQPAQDSESCDQQPMAPLKLSWRQGKEAPGFTATLGWGTATVHGDTAYFMSGCIYSYTLADEKWTRLAICMFDYSALAILEEKVTTIGGGHDMGLVDNQNVLLSLCEGKWKEVFPPMSTKRMCPAVVNTGTHLVVAGGCSDTGHCIEVEVMNIEYVQWLVAGSLPLGTNWPQVTLCAGHLYLTESDWGVVMSCSLEALLKSCKPAFYKSSDCEGVWNAEMAPIPTRNSSLTTLNGCLLAVGGKDADGAIHCYDEATDSWKVVGEMPTPRYDVLTAVLGNHLVVVGSYMSSNLRHINEIGRVEP